MAALPPVTEPVAALLLPPAPAAAAALPPPAELALAPPPVEALAPLAEALALAGAGQDAAMLPSELKHSESPP